jgi:hypothetical protein
MGCATSEGHKQILPGMTLLGRHRLLQPIINTRGKPPFYRRAGVLNNPFVLWHE